MDRDQQYLTTLLDKVPKWELADPKQQDAFDKIKSSLTNAPDLQAQLKALFMVSNFSDLALGLMWIAERVSRDPSKLESSLEEESFVLGLLKKAFGGSPIEEGSSETAAPEQPLGFDFPQAATEEPSQAAESTPADSAFGINASSSPSVGDDAGSSEEGFSATLEKLLEAIQSGSEERTVLLDQLSVQAEAIVGAQSTDNDYKTFCGYLLEFLKYVSVNQLFDDIRVMNLVSNVYDPFAQWAKTDPGARAGMLDQSNEMLRDFKALFE